jgi:hypothetical protein
MPVRLAGNAARLVVLMLVTGAAGLPGHTIALGAAPHEVDVGMAIISLAGKVRGRMTVQASRIPKNGRDPAECLEASGSL